MRRIPGVLSVAAALVLAAGCSSTHRKPSAATTSTTSTSLAPATSSTSSGSTSTSAPPTSASGPGRCQPASLKGTFSIAPGGSSAGHVGAQLTLTNSGTAACHLAGYVGMQLLDSSGGSLPTNVVRVPGTVADVLLAPGASAIAIAQFSATVPGQGDSQTGSCQPVAKNTEITPPDDTTFLVVPGPNSPVCQRGTIDIQPLQPAGSAGQ